MMRTAKQGMWKLGLAVGLAALVAVPLADARVRELRSLSGNFLAGQAAAQARDVKNAAKYFTNALALDPDNPVLMERAFMALLGAGQIRDAESLARRLIQVNPRHRLAHIVLGLAAMRNSRHAVARSHFEKSAYTPIGELTSGLLTAWSYAAERNHAKAVEALGLLDRDEGFAIYKLFHEALISDVLGMKTKAAGLYRKAYDESSNSLRIVQAYGNFLERNGQIDEARELYEGFLGVTTDHPVIKHALDRLNNPANGKPKPFVGNATDGAAEAMFGLASALTDESGIELALTYARLTLGIKPDMAVVQTLLGDIFEGMKQHEAAIEAYQAVPADSPLKVNAEVRIAINLSELKEPEKAIKHLQGVVAKNPNNFEAFVTLGTLLRSESRFEEAAEAYTKALDLVGEPTQRHWSVLYFRGIAYERSKQWEKAEADFLKALELEPEQPMVLNYLGYSWLEQGRNLDEALAMIEMAVEQRPNDGYIIDSLGWAFYKRGDYDRAVEELEKAIELQPSDPTINDHLGDAYWQVGRKLEAKFQWKHAKDNDPEPDLLKTIEEKLANGLPEPEAPKNPTIVTPGSDKRS